MNETPEIDRAQLNVALEQRTAGRDYHEYFIPSSVKLMLATSSKVKLDNLAIDNERLFGYRFGFQTTRPVRQQLIDFQNKYDLLDAEIRWLKRAGHLRVNRLELTIDTSRVMPIYGWIQVAFLSVIFAYTIFQIGWLAKAPDWKRDLLQLGLGAIWFGVAAVLIKMFVAPWRTLKQSGVIDARALLSDGASQV